MFLVRNKKKNRIIIIIFFFIDSDSDTIVTADSLFNSPSESLIDLNLISPSSISQYNPLITNTSGDSNRTVRRYSSDSNSSSGSSDTLVDAASISSVASSCVTYISQGGDAYKCARSDVFSNRRSRKKSKKQHVDEIQAEFTSRLVPHLF